MVSHFLPSRVQEQTFLSLLLQPDSGFPHGSCFCVVQLCSDSGSVRGSLC